MGSILIDLDLIDEDGYNPFESIMSNTEKLSLNGSLSFSKSIVEDTVMYLERKLQDLSEANDGKSKVLYSRVFEAVCSFTKSAEIGSTESYDVAIAGLNSVITAIRELDHGSIEEINRNFDILSPKAYLLDKGKTEASIEELNMAAMITVTNFGLIHPAPWVSTMLGLKAQGNLCTEIWDIEFIFHVSKANSHKPLMFLNEFIEILNKIDGVTVILDDIKIGSLVAKMKAIFEDAKSKEEVKELIEVSKKFAQGKLEKDFVENENTKAQTEKIEVEKEILRDQLKKETSIESDYKRALEIQSQEEDLKKKKIENFRSELQAFKEARDTYKEMLSDGFISNGDFEILIKGIPFLQIKNGSIVASESIDVIDKM